jgi:hypothetical protein
VDVEAVMEEIDNGGFGVPQRKLAECFGDSDNMLSHRGTNSPEIT